MKRKILFSALGTILLLSTYTHKAQASEKVAGASAVAMLPDTAFVKADNRVKVMRAYLESVNSPMVDSAETFVKAADENDLDWKFVAAISGLESGFGKQIPYNSYNGWGWGIYGDNVIYFTSWDNGIETVSQGLRQRYINKLGTDDVYAIGKMYASSPTWAVRVELFMNKIEAFADSYNATSPILLSLSI